MKELLNNNAKQPYYYRRYYMDEDILHSGFFLKMLKRTYVPPVVSTGRGKYAKSYYEIYCGFDIETYTTESNNGFMYIWQFSINNNVIIGRTWEQFDRLLCYLQDGLFLDSKHRLLIWVANLSYEFQFIRKRLHITDYFFKKERQPLKVSHNDCIDFMECLTISGGSLDYLARTYTNTQKCVNDLEYNIPRNSMTVLNDTELTYCDNDVLILSEWSEYYFNEFIHNGFMPVTMQSILRKNIKDKAIEWHIAKGGKNKRSLSLAISSCQPKEKTYHYIMTWCFRGGYVHGNIAHVTDLLCYDNHIMSFDFTSSYPSVMEHGYYPSRLYTKKNVNCSQYLELIKNNCVIATIKFYDVRAKTNHSIESKSKCIELVNPVIDNGRVLDCDSMTVCITELDFLIYNKFYDYSKFEVINCLVANRIKLPDYLLTNMEQAYTDKDKLKKSGLPYEIPKSRLNSYYGVICTRLQDEEITYADDNYGTEKAKPYDEQIASNPLLAQWSIYVTAWARFNLLSTVATIGNDVLYCDTDSIKFKNCFSHLWVIDLYNKRQKELNKKLCEKRGLPIDTFYDLGCFDYEGKMFYLKYLGAKRYIYTTIKKDKTTKLYKLSDNQTIAGLPKNKLLRLYPKREDLYNSFTDRMELIDSDKLYTYYNDDYVEEVVIDNEGNKVLMSELSNIGLSPTSFKLSLDKVWIEFFMEYQENIKHLEKR